MDPHIQSSLSTVYIPRPLTFIPVAPDLFHVFESYGTNRKFLLELSAAELPGWLASDFEARKARNLSSLAAYQRSIPAGAFDPLDLSAIDIKL